MANLNNPINSVTKYRGLGAAVVGLSNLQEILERSGLNWRTISLPMQIVGKTQTRPSGFRSLVRSDNGEELGVSTSSYKPVHNEQIVGSMLKAAEVAGGIELERIGSLDGGRRVWAIGTVPKTSFDLPIDPMWEQAMRNNPDHGWIKDDKTVLKVLMGSGHVPGTAWSLDFMAERQICTNGAKITHMMARFRMVHSATFDVNRTVEIQRMIANSHVAFEKYGQKALAMRESRVTDAIGKAFTVQLMQPELVKKAVKDGQLPTQVLDAGTVGGHYNGISTPHLLEAVEGAVKVNFFDPQTFSRPVNRVLELVNTQPGAAMAAGTLWNRYNAVTYFVDHERGRSADSGLNAAFFGDGAQLKQQALELADQYAYVLRGGRR